MVFRVALVGHSQLPAIEDYDEVEFELFKIPGARIKDFKYSERIRSNEWDCVIIFLGGNDLCDHHDADQVVNELLELVSEIQARSIILTQIEKRTYSPARERRHGITTEQYNSLANVTNNKLKRRKRSLGTFHLIHCPAGYNLDSRDGGIHFSETAARSLTTRYMGAIRHAQGDN